MNVATVSRSSAAAGASVSQLITDFGRTNNLVSSSQFHAKAEDQNALATQQDIALAKPGGLFPRSRNLLEVRVHGDRQRLLGIVLADDIQVEVLDESTRLLHVEILARRAGNA